MFGQPGSPLRYSRALLENQIKSAIGLSDSNALRGVLAKAEHSDLEGRGQKKGGLRADSCQESAVQLLPSGVNST